MHAGVYAVGHRAYDRPRPMDGRHARVRAACSATTAPARSTNCPISDNGLTRVTRHASARQPRIDVHRARPPSDATAPPATASRSPRSPGPSSTSHTPSMTSPSTASMREAQFRGLFDDDRIRDALTRRPSARLKAYLDDPTVTQTELEDRFLRICRRYRIPTPVTQHGPSRASTSPGRTAGSSSRSTAGRPTAPASPSRTTGRTPTDCSSPGTSSCATPGTTCGIRHAEVAAQVLSAGNFSSTHSGPSSSRRYGRPPTRT